MSRSTTFYDSKKVLVKTGSGEMVPFEAGIVKSAHVNFAWVILFLVWAATLGVFIWLIIEFERDRKYFCDNASLFEDAGYIKFQGTAAEPYSGRPARVLTGVTALAACQTDCNNDSECRFFTHDLTHGKCYMYREGILPEQNAMAALPGPTNFESDVYVKKFERAVELRGVLRDGK